MFDFITINEKVVSDIRSSSDNFQDYSDHALLYSILQRSIYALAFYTDYMNKDIQRITILPTDGSVRNASQFRSEYGDIVNIRHFYNLIEEEDDNVDLSLECGMLLKAHVEYGSSPSRDYHFLFS